MHDELAHAPGSIRDDGARRRCGSAWRVAAVTMRYREGVVACIGPTKRGREAKATPAHTRPGRKQRGR
jgi:hypothetical protein